MSDILIAKDFIEKQGDAWQEFKAANNNRLERLEDNARSIEDFMAKIIAPGGSSSSHA